MNPLTACRSLLFVPAHRYDFVSKAASRGADGVILDLEDGVPADQKEPGRRLLARHLETLRPSGLPVLVRTRRMAEDGDADIRAAVAAGASLLMLPKVQEPANLLDAFALADQCPGAGPVRILAQIEDALGILNAPAIARAHPRIAGLAFGPEDFALSMHRQPTATLLFGPAQQLVLAAAAAGLPSFGWPASFARFRHATSLKGLARRTAAMGFTGVLCIHPDQVEIANHAFLPSAELVAWAERIVANGREEGGAIGVDGQMVDRPVLERAKLVLEQARRAGPAASSRH
jgi:citrate lyase subunit beta/citryl-CoA lyase